MRICAVGLSFVSRICFIEQPRSWELMLPKIRIDHLASLLCSAHRGLALLFNMMSYRNRTMDQRWSRWICSVLHGPENAGSFPTLSSVPGPPTSPVDPTMSEAYHKSRWRTGTVSGSFKRLSSGTRCTFPQISPSSQTAIGSDFLPLRESSKKLLLARRLKGPPSFVL